jgi:SET domain-containing protein
MEEVHAPEGQGAIHLPQCQLYLKSVPGKGRGVYAAEVIPSGTLIHISPVLIFPQDPPHAKTSSGDPMESSQIENHEKQILSHYTYTWGANEQALALGLGSMFNHSRHNNVGFLLNKPEQIISYLTLREVSAHEELCISYGNNLWFDDLADYSSVSKRGEQGIGMAPCAEEEDSDSESGDFLLRAFRFDDH